MESDQLQIFDFLRQSSDQADRRRDNSGEESGNADNEKNNQQDIRNI